MKSKSGLLQRKNLQGHAADPLVVVCINIRVVWAQKQPQKLSSSISILQICLGRHPSHTPIDTVLMHLPTVLLCAPKSKNLPTPHTKRRPTQQTAVGAMKTLGGRRAPCCGKHQFRAKISTNI